jgi:hypothetical protein
LSRRKFAALGPGLRQIVRNGEVAPLSHPHIPANDWSEAFFSAR